MWVNLGRNVGEYPYIRTMAKGGSKDAGIALIGGDAMHEMQQHGGFVICGHFANWEMLGIAFAQKQHTGFGDFIVRSIILWRIIC